MAKSGAERQAEYRQRHLKDLDGDAEVLNTLVSSHAKRQLERLAFHQEATQRATLEKVLAEAERALLDALPAQAHRAYYDQRRTETSTEKSTKAKPAPKKQKTVSLRKRTGAR